jgi:hypothetical protein
MQAINAETEQSDENEVERLIVDRILNHVRELVLSTTDSVENEKAYEIMNEQPELEVNRAEATAYLNIHQNFGEDMELKTKTTRIETSGVVAYNIPIIPIAIGTVVEIGKVVMRCIRCRRLRCR